MTWVAIGMVLLAAFFNAVWNLLAKKACGGTAFVWLFGLLSVIVYSPIAIWILVVYKPEIGLTQIGILVGSTLLHVLYYLLLVNGYQIGDLSVIYPLARGTGPLLSTVLAIMIFDETPSTIALVGILLIAAGIIFVVGNPLNWAKTDGKKPILFAFICGTVIATYTVWDKAVVSIYLIPPLLLEWFSGLGRLVLLAPFAMRNWPKVKAQWANNKKEVIGVAILCPLGYILILTAMTFSPVSYIASLREFSILIGSLMGATLLSEGNVRIRILGAGAMVAGLMIIALS